MSGVFSSEPMRREVFAILDFIKLYPVKENSFRQNFPLIKLFFLRFFLIGADSGAISGFFKSQLQFRALRVFGSENTPKIMNFYLN